jgi:hypothetical protein
VPVPVLLMSGSVELPDRAAELGVDDFHRQAARPASALERRLAAMLERDAA